MTFDPETRLFESNRDNQKAAWQLAGEYAKWFISTVLLLHSGAIAALFQSNSIKSHATAAAILGFGILLALGSAYVGWLNLQWASHHFRQATYDHIERKPQSKCPSYIKTSGQVAVCLIMLSVFCLALAMVMIWINPPFSGLHVSASQFLNSAHPSF
jgi:hypothetical protein